MSHTPTPWNYHFNTGPRNVRLKRAHWALGVTGGKGIGLIFGDDQSDAAFIVQCVNSHAALVEALTYLLNETEDYIRINHLSALHNHSLEMARAALALAQKDAP
jgi:hypothetical protein